MRFLKSSTAQFVAAIAVAIAAIIAFNNYHMQQSDPLQFVYNTDGSRTYLDNRNAADRWEITTTGADDDEAVARAVNHAVKFNTDGTPGQTNEHRTYVVVGDPASIRHPPCEKRDPSEEEVAHNPHTAVTVIACTEWVFANSVGDEIVRSRFAEIKKALGRTN